MLVSGKNFLKALKADNSKSINMEVGFRTKLFVCAYSTNDCMIVTYVTSHLSGKAANTTGFIEKSLCT
jgi:hypothetical protein